MNTPARNHILSSESWFDFEDDTLFDQCDIEELEEELDKDTIHMSEPWQPDERVLFLHGSLNEAVL